LNRRKRQSKWTDLDTIWPPLTPRTISKKHKGVVSQSEADEFERLKMLKNFEYPDFNIGDVVKFHYLHSLSEGRGNTYTGIVISK
jgi:ribosomal protein L19